jgi:hypothetical protein
MLWLVLVVVQGRQPGWLFDDADAAEAAANSFFQQETADCSNFGQPSACRMPAGMFSTPPAPPSKNSPVEGPGSNSRTPASRGAAYGAALPSRGDVWGAAAGNLPAGGPWDELRITQKLIRCIGPELSACESC